MTLVVDLVFGDCIEAELPVTHLLEHFGEYIIRVTALLKDFDHMFLLLLGCLFLHNSLMFLLSFGKSFTLWISPTFHFIEMWD